MLNRIKTETEIKAIRESGRMLATVLARLEKSITVGVTTKELAQIAGEELKSLGGTPAFLGYQGFPDVLCTSVNDAVVHGIPNDKKLKDGDIVGLDFGVIYDGMITDAARSYVVGEGSKASTRLLSYTQRSLDKAIDAVRHGASVGDISAAAQKVMEDGGYGIVRDLVGHGVGHHVHEEPEIANYGIAGTGSMLRAGMTIAIEPMATMGDWKVVIDPDGWTIRTRDGSLSAHFEDTVLVTEKGSEILTRL